MQKNEILVKSWINVRKERAIKLVDGFWMTYLL